MICKFCGNEIDDGSDFCYICGQKVEEPAPAFAAASDVYSQSAAAPVAPAQAPVAPAPAAAQPVQPAAPVQAPVPPAAYAAPVAPGTYAEGVADQGGKKKRAKKVKDPNMASGAQRFFSFLLFFIVGPILYKKEKKNGNETKAISILNATMRGLCVFMAIVIVVMIKIFVM